MSNHRAWLRDLVEAFHLVGQLAWRRTVTAWIYVPIGLIIILLACWGVDSLISLGSVSFPASVALLIVLFFALIVSQSVLGDRTTKRIVRVIDVPAGFALHYINVFFTPSFVVLPLSPPIAGVEIGKITAVFLIGFVVTFVITAYFTRGLQLLLGTSKRVVTERGEELGTETPDIPLTNSPRISRNSSIAASLNNNSTTEPYELITMPTRTQDPAQVRGTGGPPPLDTQSQTTSPPPRRQQPLPLTRPQRWATFINRHLDLLTYLTLFLLVGLPTYYLTPLTFPAHLTLTTLSYFLALSLPPTPQKFLHPVLTSSFLTALGIYLLALSSQTPFTHCLRSYKTSSTFPYLSPSLPGAGDILTSLLTVSIISLSIPMYTYRHDLLAHLPSILLPCALLATTSLFLFPPLCTHIGISPPRALSFASRTLTLALATPATKNLGGDENLVAVLCIMSGVLGVLLGPGLLKWIRVPEDDYVTRGVSLGGNGSAIATALLLGRDPRGAALGCLSLGVLGCGVVLLTSVGAVGDGVRRGVGLG